MFRFSRKQHIWRNWFKEKPEPPVDYILQNKKSKTKIVMAENKFGFDEVVDTLGDLIQAAGPDGIREAFTGRFELVRFLIKAAEVYPRVQEAINDFGTFWEQLKDLTPQESLQAAGSIAARFPTPDPVQKSMIIFIRNAALTQDYLQDQVIAGAQNLIGKWKEL